MFNDDFFDFLVSTNQIDKVINNKEKEDEKEEKQKVKKKESK